MIWSVVTKTEMESYGTNPVFRFYREALGKENIRLAVVDEDDVLDFVKSGDTIILRTASKMLIDTITRKRIVSTAELFSTYELVKDKILLGDCLRLRGIDVPCQYNTDELQDCKTYFVKPRYGSDSFGVSAMSICRSKADVDRQLESIKEDAIIEDFIQGTECTTACYYDPRTKSVRTCSIAIECDETDGIQTRDCKVGFKEYCYSLDGETAKRANEISREVFSILGLKHYARMDFRRDQSGKLFVIDVNLMPGLGPIDHFAKCLLLSDNISYVDAIKAVVATAM